MFGYGNATDGSFDEGEIVTTELGYRAEDVSGLLRDFGADAVAGEDCNFEAHDCIPLLFLFFALVGNEGGFVRLKKAENVLVVDGFLAVG